MKPLNLDNSPCSPISSNCVIWQGPDIECIKLCKGDTVSDVVFKLATELCEILEILDISNYDLSCFNLTSCAPADFQALINFLIERICALENLPSTGSTTPGAGECPTDCIVQVAPCLATSPNQTLSLIDYVNLIATTLCNAATNITILQAAVNTIQTQVNNLTIIVDGLNNYTTPSFSLDCDIGILNEDTSYTIDVILEAFINSVWCPMNTALVGSSGTPSDLTNAIASQCTLGTDFALSVQYTIPSSLLSIYYSGSWVNTPVSLADTIRNLWVALCDVRNAEIMEYEVTTTEDITINTSVIGTMTTFEIGRTPKVYAYQEAIFSLDITTDPGFVDNTYFMPLAYSSLNYVNTTGATKDFLVRVSFDTIATINPFLLQSISNKVDGAIIKNNNSVTPQYQSIGTTALGNFLVDSVTGIVITPVSAQTVVTIPSINPVTTSLGLNAVLPRNVSFFKLVTLAPTESIQLMFRALTGNTARLLRAQIFVEEIR